MRGRGNAWLWAGVVGVLVLLAVAVLGPHVAPYGPGERDFLHVDRAHGAIRMAVPPFPPSGRHLLGTDKWGFDIFSLLLQGARWTLALAAVSALLRVAWGLALAVVSRGARWAGWARWAALATSGVPGVVFLFFAVRASVWGGISNSVPVRVPVPSVWHMGLTMAAWIAVVDVFTVAHTLGARIRAVLAEPYIEGAVAAGATSWGVFRRHVWPHVLPYACSLFALEVARSLWTIGQLGIFWVFFGGKAMFFDDLTHQTFAASQSGEWGGLLGQGARWIRLYPWQALAPAAAFTFAIASFQALGAGLQRHLDRRAGQA